MCFPPIRGVLVHPAPIYETFGAFVIAGILVSLEGTQKLSIKGQRFGLYLVLSALARFLVEYVRIEPVVFAGFTQAQLVALGAAVVGALFIAAPLRRVRT